MAATFRVGKGRRTNIPKPVYLPEARAAANAVGQVLVAKYGKEAWILQIMEAVMGAVQRGIDQLGASAGPQANAMPGDIQMGGYAMPARTREDVIQHSPQILQQASDIAAPTNRQLVAQGMQEENNDMFALLSRAADPAVAQLGQGVPNQPMPQPMQQGLVSQTGLVLPNQPQEVPHERTSPGHHDDAMSWLL